LVIDSKIFQPQLFPSVDEPQFVWHFIYNKKSVRCIYNTLSAEALLQCTFSKHKIKKAESNHRMTFGMHAFAGAKTKEEKKRNDGAKNRSAHLSSLHQLWKLLAGTLPC